MSDRLTNTFFLVLVLGHSQWCLGFTPTLCSAITLVAYTLLHIKPELVGYMQSKHLKLCIFHDPTKYYLYVFRISVGISKCKIMLMFNYSVERQLLIYRLSK